MDVLFECDCLRITNDGDKKIQITNFSLKQEVLEENKKYGVRLKFTIQEELTTLVEHANEKQSQTHVEVFDFTFNYEVGYPESFIRGRELTRNIPFKLDVILPKNPWKVAMGDISMKVRGTVGRRPEINQEISSLLELPILLKSAI